MKRNQTLHVAYLLKSFPVTSETFIINEISELKRRGLDISVFSLEKPRQNVHTEVNELIKETHYMEDMKPKSKLRRFFSLLYSHGYFFFTNPVHYFRVFLFVYRMDREAFSLFLRVFYLAMVLRKLKVDAIHTHFAVTSAECAMLVSIITKIPYSFTIHAYDVFIESRLIKEKIEHARFVISISEFNKEFVKANFFKDDGSIVDDKFRVVHCGVKLDRLLSHQARDCENDDKTAGKSNFTILSTGRLVEKKGYRYLIEACQILTNSGCIDFTLNIIGDGLLKDELNSLVSKLGLKERVNFLGTVTQEEVFYNLGQADLFVLPCVVAENGDMDGIPVSLMEAMALKKPVISTSLSGIPELVRDGAGILVPPRDSKSLAQAIKKIYLMGKEERKKIGEKGQEIVRKEFDIEKESAKIKYLFVSTSVN